MSASRIRADLDALPLGSAPIVLVHSSLKAIGYVDGGAEVVVDALIHSVVDRRGGTVLLPTFSIEGTMRSTLRSGRVFDVRRTASNLGAIPETFRRRPQARRSLHPTHSFAAIGRDADWLVDGHHLAGSSFGIGTPMAKMIAAGGSLLGIGSDLGHVTFYHCLEEIEADFPLDVFSTDSPIEAVCRDGGGGLHRVSLAAHAPEMARRRIDHPASDALRRFYRHRLEQMAGLSWHDIGHARSWLIQAPRLYDEIKGLMRSGITVYSTADELLAFERKEARKPALTLSRV